MTTMSDPKLCPTCGAPISGLVSKCNYCYSDVVDGSLIVEANSKAYTKCIKTIRESHTKLTEISKSLQIGDLFSYEIYHLINRCTGGMIEKITGNTVFKQYVLAEQNIQTIDKQLKMAKENLSISGTVKPQQFQKFQEEIMESVESIKKKMHIK